MGYREATADSIVHVYNRGVKKLDIFREPGDLLRLKSGLFYFNTIHQMPPSWARDVALVDGIQNLAWLDHWEPREPMVSVLAFTIMPNHFHLVLKEKIEDGIRKFMHRFGMSYAKFINEKYGESGSLFEGPYKSRRVDEDSDFRNLLVYTMVKNPFELYPGGLVRACENFNRAYEHALAYPLTSLGEYEGRTKPQILDDELLRELGEEPHAFKAFAKERMANRLDQLDLFDFR